jgi:hypothetical protein
MLPDIKHRFYNDIANKILNSNGIIYGGYVRDMILYKLDKSRDIPIDKRTYPNDIDIIISENNIDTLTDKIKTHYKIEVLKNIAANYHHEKKNILCKTIKIIVSDEHNNVINIDCIYIEEIDDLSIDTFMKEVESYFKSTPIDFRINRLAYDTNDNYVQYIKENGELELCSDEYINYIEKKIARCHHGIISEQKLPVFTKRITKMLSKGFLVVTNNKRNKIILNKNETDNLPRCLVCEEYIKDTLVYQQNGCFNKCETNFHRHCIYNKGNDHYNKCTICNQTFGLFKNEAEVINESSEYI